MSRENLLKFFKKTWLVLFLVAGFAFVFAYLREQAGKLEGVLYFSALFFFLAVTLHLAFWTSAAWCWGRVVLFCNEIKLPLLVCFSHLALLTIGKYFPGKIWGMAARAALMKEQDINLSDALLATFQEQFIFLHAAVVLSGIFFGILFKTGWAWGICLLAVISIPVGLLSQNYAVKLFNHFAPRLGLRGKLDNWRAVRADNYLALLTAYSIVWLLSGMAFACIYLTFFNSPMNLELLGALVLANTVGNTLGFLAFFAPGGVGVREAVASGILAGFIPLNDAIMLSLLFRLWVTLFELLAALTLLWPGTRSFKA